MLLVLRRVGPKVLMLAGIVQGALHWADAQLDVVGRLLGQAGSGFGWLLVAGLFAAGLLWEIRQRDAGEVTAADEPAGPSLRVRQKLIAAVQAQWITGVLDRSLEMMARVEVGLSARPDAVEHPWGALVSLPSGDVRTLPADTALLDVYDECRTGLLVLGEPGAGKTTALLELARDLLCRAERDPKLPVPVVFHLSSWAAEHTSMAQWLAAELTRRYGVSPGLARDWLRTEAVLPLLDGLDEVDQTRREACVAAINAWRDEHGMLAAVVCSRTADYERLAERLRLASAVVLQPLSRSAVASYLRAAGRPMAGVRAVLARDERLWELLTTPLMLSIVVLAYARVPATHIRADGDIETRRCRLLTDYVDAMLARPRSGLARDRPCHQPVEIRRWLSWLAETMSRRHESVFYPDWLQVSSLTDRQDRVRAVVQPALLVGIATAVAALVIDRGLLLTTGFSLPFRSAWWFIPLLFGAVAALACGQTRIAPARQWQRWAVTRFVRALVAGGGAGLVTAMVSNWVLPLVPLGGWQFLSAYYFGWLLFGGVAGNLATRAVESLARGVFRCPDEPGARRVSRHSGALVSMSVIATVVSVRLLHTTGFTVPVMLWSVLQLALFGSAVALSRPIADLTPTTPGEAMRRTHRQAITTGAVMAVLVSAVWHLGLDRLGSYLGARWSLWPLSSLTIQFILFTGWLSTLSTGLSDYLRHRTVLRILARQGHVPKDLLGFLDYADSHILLRRTGGGYTFVHRLVLEYFATSPAARSRGPVARANARQGIP